MSIPTEHDEQVALVTWFSRAYPCWNHLLWATPNGGSRNRIEAAKLRKEGVRRGVPDLFLALPLNGFHGLFIEMKRQKGGTVSPEQKAMLKALTEQGYIAQIARGCDEGKSIINHYLGASNA